MKNISNCDNISKHLNANEFPQTKITPFTVLAPKHYLDQIDFETIINNNTRWDQDQWRVPPGTLALSLVLTSFFRTDKRYPLCSVEEIVEFMDSKLVFGKEFPHSYFNDDCLGLLLDRIHEAGCTGLFSMVALQAFAKLKIPFGNVFQVDTTSHVYYGDSKICEEENYEGLKVTYGYSKDKRPDKKQVMSGMITNELGIPLHTEILDGNTADTVWLPDAICHFRNLFSEMYSDSIFIADSKLVSKKNFGILFDKANPLSFISRCPEKFCSRIAEMTVSEAYSRNKWEYVGSCCKDEESKRAVKYEVQGFNKTIHENECRLIVFRNVDGDERLVHELKKERENIEEGVKKEFKKPYACEADAKKAIDEFAKKYKNPLHNIIFEIHEETTEKKPIGRPSKGQEKFKIISEFYVKLKSLEQNKEKVEKRSHSLETVVLITNVPSDIKNDKEIFQLYKNQQVVETNFEELKKPSMFYSIFLEKPERIEALLMLLHVSLLIRVIMRIIARENLKKEKDPLRIDFGRSVLKNPTAEKMLRLLSFHSIITMDGKQIVCAKNGKVDHLRKLLQLLGLSLESG
ncbi:MAG: hypothetical protein QG646_3267 [Euryarchaeota archaeon]|nr:hypothetical protein [Euryarchaeota archaeon]